MIHRREGTSNLIHHRGHVLLEGTDKEDIQVLIHWRATSEVLAEGIEISLNNENEVVITVFSPSPMHLLMVDYGTIRGIL